jgi:hypothetical protein
MIFTQLRTTSYLDNEHLVDRFEALLGRYGIAIAIGSELERVCLEVRHLLDLNSQPLEASNKDLRGPLRDALGLHHFAKMVFKSETQSGFGEILAHLKLLNRGSALQNTRSKANDQASNKLFELLVGMAALSIANTTVELDHPDHSKGDNPDVLVTLNSRTWGLACKVPNGSSDMSLFENIEKGVEQIENSKATRGAVVINFKNTIPHDDIFPILGRDDNGDLLIPVYTDLDYPKGLLCHYVTRRCADMQAHVGTDELRKLFAGKKAVPIALVVVQEVVAAVDPIVAAVATNTGVPVQSRPTFLGFLQVVPFGIPIDSETCEFMRALNLAFDVL